MMTAMMMRSDWFRMPATVLHSAAVAYMVLAVATAPLLAAEATQPAVADNLKQKRVIGYFAEWSKHYHVTSIPADKLTHVNYAFAVIRDGECAMKDNLAAGRHFPLLQTLKRQHPHLRTLISIGGWTDSGPFSDVALTPESREKFSRSCADFIKEHGFDGVDIDWEYPGGGGHDKTKGRPEDKQNFTLLLQDLRRALDEQGQKDDKHYLLTIAAPAGGQHKRIELDRIHPLLDFINLMTYDFAGHWSDRTAFNAPLHPWDDHKLSADTAVQAYLDAGVPKEKLVLGVPFYGRAFAGVAAKNHGLGQEHSGKPPRAAGSSVEWSWRTIGKHHLDQATRHWHEQAKVPYLYDAENRLFISYDDPESLRLKARYVRGHNLGGVMIWELSQDDEKSSLLNALHAGLRIAPATQPDPVSSQPEH